MTAMATETLPSHKTSSTNTDNPSLDCCRPLQPIIFGWSSHREESVFTGIEFRQHFDSLKSTGAPPPHNYSSPSIDNCHASYPRSLDFNIRPTMSAAFVERSSMPQPNAYSHAHRLPATRQSSWDFMSLLQEQPNNTISKTAIDDSEKIGSDIVVVAAPSRRKDWPKPRTTNNVGVLQDLKDRNRPLAGARMIESTAAAHKKRSVAEMLGYSEQPSSKDVKRPKLDSGRAGETLLTHGSRPKQNRGVTMARKPIELIVLDDEDAKIPSPEWRRHPPFTRNDPVKPNVKSGLDGKPGAMASGPFIIDDSSSDEEGGRPAGKKPTLPKKQATPSEQPPTARPGSATSSESVQAQKLAQRLASKRMREEVEERRLGLHSSRTSSIALVTPEVQSGSQLWATGQNVGAAKEQQQAQDAQGAKVEMRVGKAEVIVVLNSPNTSRSSNCVGQQHAERFPPKSATAQANVAPNTYRETAKIGTNLSEAPTRAEATGVQTPPHSHTAEQTGKAQREPERRGREMAEAEAEREAQAMREVDARIESEARAREAEAKKREANAQKQDTMRQEVQVRRDAEAKRQRLQMQMEVEARRKQALNDEDEVSKKVARETESQAMREVDARIEVEARERKAEEMKEEDLRRQTEKRKEVLRQQLGAKRDAEAKWEQRLRDEEEGKKRAKEREVRKRLEAEEAKKAGDEARRKQQEVRDAMAKRLAAPSLLTPSSPLDRRAGYSVPQSSLATREGATAPESSAAPTNAKALGKPEAASVSTAIGDADSSKQERIRALKERNARYQHDAEASNSSSSRDPERRYAEPGPQGQTSGSPASWHHDTRHEPGQSRQDNFAPLHVNSAFPRPSNGSNDRRLHKITPADVTMLKLKHSGLPWNDICIALRKAEGIQETTSALAKRWTQLRSMLTSSDPSMPLLELDNRVEDVTVDQLRDLVQSSAPSNDGYSVTLGDITACDVKLLQWHSDCLTFGDMVPLYEHAAGIRRSHDSLNRRFKMVKAAIEGLNISASQLDQVASGDVAARTRLNSAVNGRIRATVESPVFRDANSTSGNSRPLKTIGEITQFDIAVVRRRESGMTFSAILPIYQHQSGFTFGESSLRRRHAAVRTAIEQHRVDEALLNRVVAGDVAAKKELNRLVYGTWPVPQAKATPVRPRAVPNSGPIWQSSGATSACNAVFDLSFETSSTRSTRERSNSPSDSKPSTAATSFDADEEPSHRSTTAGKTMNAAAYERYLDAALAELHKPGSDDEEEPEEKLTEEDLCHFAYSVQRREVSKEELDEGVELDELQWVDCGRPFTDLHRANTEANRQSAMSNDPDTLAALIEGGSLVRDRDENGLVFATHSTKHAGTVEVRVERRLRTFKRGVRPRLDGGLVSCVVFSVRERTVKVEDHQDVDVDKELFGGDEPRRTLLADIQVEEATYSTLELANDFAIKHFVKMAFRSASRNLDQRSLEEAQMRKGLLEELDEEGSDGMFRRTVEVEKGKEKTEVEVSVTKGPFRGPRNML
ncbi:hypothetical protein LTR02_012066 [Friedmanniomyces endolithicus]|nr:hypothetical protein LTR87_007730 [Friedmanniomyces endolithicus]KAK0894858.1 hypothetical protein LTR02_012066 [Friedmanniomyces endolithicus]